MIMITDQTNLLLTSFHKFKFVQETVKQALSVLTQHSFVTKLGESGIVLSAEQWC